MKRGTLTLALAGVALALAVPFASAFSDEPAAGGNSPAVAQEAGPGAPAQHPHHGWGPHGGPGAAFEHQCQNADAHRAAILAFAEVKLQITEAQKPAWTKFADAVKAAGQFKAKLCTDFAGKPGPATLPERLSRAEQVAQAKLAEIQAVRPALGELYAQLTPDQQKLADSLIRHHGHHHGPHGDPHDD